MLNMERREFKTSPEQWKVVVEFFEEHPSLVKGKFGNFDGDHQDTKKLWEELTIRLNSMGLGARNSNKWQLAIGRWKSKTKGKASQLKLEMEKTGGGQVKAPPLNAIEERLMALIGWKAVTGDRNLELGLTPIVPAASTTPRIVHAEPVASTSRAQSASPPPLNFSEHSEEQIGDILPPLTPINKKRLNSSTRLTTASPKTRRGVRLTTEKSRKMVTLSQMHKETQQRLQGIEKNTQIMAKAIQSISTDISSYVNHVINQY